MYKTVKTLKDGEWSDKLVRVGTDKNMVCKICKRKEHPDKYRCCYDCNSAAVQVVCKSCNKNKHLNIYESCYECKK